MPWYPVDEVGALERAVFVALAAVHVLCAQFAVGGGALLFAFDAAGRRDADARAACRAFVDGPFKACVLAAFVLGALTGVGMWGSALIHAPRAATEMAARFHWIWTADLAGFCIEIVAGYAFYRAAPRLPDRERRALCGLFLGAAALSLFWINGILMWRPAADAPTSLWAGFFNPTFWPALLFRGAAAVGTAGIVAAVVAARTPGVDDAGRRALSLRAARFVAAFALLPAAGAWFFAALPEAVRARTAAGDPMTARVALVSAGCAGVVAAAALVGMFRRRFAPGFVGGGALLLLAVVAAAAGEKTREAVQRPYAIGGVLYAHGFTAEETATARDRGAVAGDPYPLRDAAAYPNAQVRRGARVHRRLCAACHTWDGPRGLDSVLRDRSEAQLRTDVAALQRTSPCMPPFAGNAEDVEALVRLFLWRRGGRPERFPLSEDEAALASIRAALDAAGVRPAFAEDAR
jgi:cytochrome d ubiquinol oxidase subunit I